jgi:hypothetical protein
MPLVVRKDKWDRFFGYLLLGVFFLLVFAALQMMRV